MARFALSASEAVTRYIERREVDRENAQAVVDQANGQIVAARVLLETLVDTPANDAVARCSTDQAEPTTRE